jgi:hypothetical protein
MFAFSHSIIAILTSGFNIGLPFMLLMNQLISTIQIIGLCSNQLGRVQFLSIVLIFIMFRI